MVFDRIIGHWINDYIRTLLLSDIHVCVFVYINVCVYIYVVLCLLAQSCLTHGKPMACSLPGTSVHGILQAGILGLVAMPSSRGSSHPGIEPRPPPLQVILYHLSHQGSPRIQAWVACPFTRDLPAPGIELGSPTSQVDSLPAQLPGKRI